MTNRNFINRKFKFELDSYNLKAYKVMIKHLNSKGTVIYVDPTVGEYIVANERTHYYLLVSSKRISLVNTTDVLNLNVSTFIEDKIKSKIIQRVCRDRNILRESILNRKELNLDRILTKLD
jgi:hypothetical protein